MLCIVGTNVSGAHFTLNGNLVLLYTYMFVFISGAVLVFHLLLRDGIDGPIAVVQR